MKLSKLIDEVNSEFWPDELETNTRDIKGAKKSVVINEPDSLKTISIKEIK